MNSPYQEVFGAAWFDLPPSVQLAHSVPLEATGSFEVEGDPGHAARIMRWILNLPNPGTDVPMKLSVFQRRNGIMWKRDFGRHEFLTRQVLSPGRVKEYAGLGSILFDVRAEGGRAVYEERLLRVLGLPQTGMLQISGEVEGAGEGWRVHVEVRSPIFGLICRYRGTMVAHGSCNLAAASPGDTGSI